MTSTSSPVAVCLCFVVVAASVVVFCFVCLFVCFFFWGGGGSFTPRMIQALAWELRNETPEEYYLF